MPKNDTTLTIKISTDDKVLLEKLSVATDRTMSSVIRVLIRKECEKLGINAAE